MVPPLQKAHDAVLINKVEIGPQTSCIEAHDDVIFCEVRILVLITLRMKVCTHPLVKYACKGYGC